MVVGQSVSVNVAAFFSDPDGDELSYAAESSDTTVASVSVSGNMVTLTAVAAGATTVTVTATDPSGLSARSALEIMANIGDRAALLALYEATDGPNWENHENWLSDLPMAQWHGVVTSPTGRVVALWLQANRITGPIPPELAALTELRHLWLFGNELTGPIPPELATLTGLVSLRLGGNRLTGPIPPELASLASLTDLGLSLNALTGPIPPELATLSDLESLQLYSNHLTGPIPEQLGDLVALEFLYLDHNKLSGQVPATIGDLSNLKELFLNGNQLTGPIPLELATLTDLERLQLHANQLTGSIPGQLGDLGNLKELLLHSNQLVDAIPPELATLTDLQSLQLYSNHLTGQIPEQLGDLAALEVLYLSYNKLSGQVPATIGDLSNLKELFLNGNPDLFGALPRTLLNLRDLSFFPFHGTDLCAPADQVFQDWLDGLVDWGGKTCEDTEIGHREVLLAFYESAGGANWKINDLWGSDRPLNEWYGVAADTANRVMEIDLSGNGLAGVLSQELGNLETLVRLRLTDNPSLAGELPLTLVRLLALDDLDIEGTGLCIPPSTRFLDWLTDVNRFRGPHCHDDHSNSRETASEAPLDGMISGSLDYAEDEDLFHVRVPGRGTFTLQTSGAAETWLELEGEDGLSWQGGYGPGAIVRQVLPGKYFIRVSGVERNTRGTYSLEQSFEPAAPAARAYLTQAVQAHDGAVPLVAGEDALLRVFVTAPEGVNVTMPPVRTTFYAGAAVSGVVDIPAGAARVPTEVVEASLDVTANAVIPGSVVAPGLEMVVEIDPDGTLDPSLGIGRRIPESGRIRLDVRAVPDFLVTAVPFLWGDDPDSSVVAETNGLHPGHDLFYETREWLPVSGFDLTIREPVTVDYRPEINMLRVLNDIDLVRIADGGQRYYMGVTPWVERGTVGIAFIGGRSSVSRLDGRTIAHEFGHNFSLLHSPCGAPTNVDPHYPHQGGLIGGWGYDIRNGSLVDPALHADLMTYCRNFDWISDYSFTKTTNHRTDNQALRAMVSRDLGTADKVLVVRGGLQAGRLRLDPAFVLNAPPTLPDAPGLYWLSGSDATGRELFSYRFAMAWTADGTESAASFTFAVPAPDHWAGALDRITLTGPEGTVELGRDGSPPERLVFDANSGRIRAILRGEATADAVMRGPVVTLLSRGIPDLEAWRR